MRHTFSIIGSLAATALLAACTTTDTGTGGSTAGAVSSSSSSVSSVGGSSSMSSAMAHEDMLIVRAPVANALVLSPLTVEGEAVGSWYFEASFSVVLQDADGNEITSTTAEAQDDWMTTDFVPFEATLSFMPPATDTGMVVLEKANPSGLPENAERIEIPVRFR